jgi:tape measure domain-containing protein
LAERYNAMDLANLQVTLDARKAREENKALGSELLQTADKADALSERSQKSMNNLATQAGIVKSRASDLKKEMEQAERQTLSWAQATARLMAVQGNLSGAVNVLQFALNGATNQTNQLIGAQTQLARIQNQVAQQARAAGGGGAGGGLPGGVPGASGGAGGMNWSALTTSLLSYIAAYLSLRAAISGTEELLRTKILFENLDLSLKAITGSSAAAKGEFQFLREESNRLGLNLKAVIPEFIKIEAAFSQSGFSLRQSEQIFTDVSIATRALGLTTATTNRILYDMQEMASLGTVQLRQMRQVIMQLPGGLDVAARAAGVTTEQFHKLMHDGLIPAKEFLPLFSAELAKTFGSSAQEAMHSTESELNRLSNSWTLLKKAVAEGIDFKTSLEGAAAVVSRTTAGIEAIGLAQQARDSVKGSKNFGNDYRAAMSRLMNERFPYAKPLGAQDKYDLTDEIYSRSQSFATDKEIFQGRNKPQGPPLPPGFETSSDFGNEATTKQAEGLQKLTELRDKYTEAGLEGLDKELAALKRNYDTEFKLLSEAYKASGKLILPGGTLDMSATGADFAKNGNPFEMAAATYQKAIGNARENSDIKQQSAQAQELVKQYRELAKLTEEIESASQPDKRLSELAAENQKYKERFTQLIVLDEELGVQESLYQKLNEAHARETDLINQKYAKTFTGEGTLSQLLEKRLALEMELLRLNETDSTGGERAKEIQTQLQAINKQTDLKLRTDSASPSEAFSYGWQKATNDFGTFSQNIAKTGEGLAHSLSDNLTNSIYEWARGTKSAGQAFTEMALSVTADIEKMIIKTLVLKAIQGISGVFGGGGEGGFTSTGGDAHTGGIVGSLGNSRSLSSSIFAGAQRYHTGGVVGDEVPIIARKGEGVFTTEQMAQLGKAAGGSRSNAVHIVNVNDPRMIAEYLAANPGAILNVISREKATVKRLIG